MPHEDLLAAATPVFRGSYTGLFEHFFDLVEQHALANTPVLLLATDGGDHHALTWTVRCDRSSPSSRP